MDDILQKLKAVWEQDKMMILLGAGMLLGPSLLQGRGRPTKIMRLVQLGGVGVLAYTAWKNKQALGF